MASPHAAIEPTLGGTRRAWPRKATKRKNVGASEPPSSGASSPGIDGMSVLEPTLAATEVPVEVVAIEVVGVAEALVVVVVVVLVEVLLVLVVVLIV